MELDFNNIMQPIGVALDPVFSPLTILPPYATILVMSVLLTAMIIFVSRLFVNRKLLMEIKEQMEEIKEKMNRAQKAKDEKEQTKQLGELMKANSRYMHQSLRIMMVSIAVVVIFFPWLHYRYDGVTAVSLPFTVPFIEWVSLEWFWWYVIAAFAAGTVMRKIMGSDI